MDGWSMNTEFKALIISIFIIVLLNFIEALFNLHEDFVSEVILGGVLCLSITNALDIEGNK